MLLYRFNIRVGEIVNDAKDIKGTGFVLVSSICQSKININAGWNVVEASLQRRQSET